MNITQNLLKHKMWMIVIVEVMSANRFLKLLCLIPGF